MAKIRDDFSALRGRIVLTLILAYGASLLLFSGVSVFVFPEKFFLRPFRLEWSFNYVLIQFIATLSPIQCTAVLLACSFSAPPVPSINTRPQEAFSRLISSTLVVLIVFSAGYVLLTEGLLPELRRHVVELKNKTVVARRYLEMADEAKSNGELFLSQAYLEYYLTLDPENKDARVSLRDVRIRMGDGPESEDESSARRQPRLLEMDPENLISRAAAAIDMEDYYTAYYFADLASRLSDRGSALYNDAKAIAERIQDRLSSYHADLEELQRKALFETKTQGANDLSSDDVELVTRAYFTFRILVETYPDDSESRHYLSRSVDKLKTMAYFLDEVENLVGMPGTTEVFFKNPISNGVQLVAIEHIITAETGTYARNIEIITLDDSGSLACRYTAPTGKVMPGTGGGLSLYMRGIDPNDANGTVLPTIIAGNRRACPDVLPLVPDESDLWLVSSAGRNLKSYHLTGLYGLWDTIGQYGYPADIVQMEFLMRLANAFAILILSLFALAIGWRLRSPDGRPSVGGIIFIPGFPFLAYYAIEVYSYLHRLAVGATLISWGFGPSFIILIVFEFLLLAVSLLTLATQSIKIHE